jgi:hypothetical protein
MANRFLNNIRINDAYTFPASDGNDGQVITTDGAGNLAFENVSPDAASVIYRDNFTGDDSTVTFDLQNSITDEDQTQIYIDGVYQEKSTYSISGTTITFTTAPILGHSVEVISISSINTGPTVLYQDNFTGNGNDTAFTLGQIIDNEIKTFIFLNGVYQFKNTYTVDGTTLTFDTAPANGVAIEVVSIASAVQSDSLEAGSVIIPVKNTHTASISKGTPVYITGNVGASERLQIAPADASNSAKMPAAGLLLTTLAVNEEGYVITGGYLRNLTTDTIDSTSTSSNDTVYVKAGGGLTMTKPTGSNLIQNIAKVARSASGSSGSLIVSSILRTNDIPNLTTGKIWVGDSNTVESTVIHLDESNNRLGINNNSPSYSLDVTGDANISSNVIVGGNLTVQGTETILNTQTVEVEDNILQLNTTQGSPDTATATTSGISIYRGNGVTQASFIFDDADDTWDLTNNLVVDGHVGIGTTSPDEKLDITGGYLKFNGGDYGLKGSASLTYNPVSDHYFQSSGSTKVTFKASGNVGIGTTLPDEKLHVNGNIAAINSSYPTIKVQGSDVNYQARMRWDTNNNVLEFLTRHAGTYYGDNLVLKEGKVGIGTNSPNLSSSGTALTVNSSSGANAAVEISDGGTLAGLLWGRSGTGVNIWSIPSIPLIFGTANAEKMRIDSSGRVGINVTPIYSNVPLHTKKLGGGDAYNIFEGDNVWVFGEVDYSGTKYCQIGGRYGHHSGINIDLSGNVGIGRTSDIAKKLDVLGTGLRLQDTSNYSSITIGASGWNQDYPYQRLDTFNTDGTGYFWAFGHRRTDGHKTVRMLISDGSSRYVTVISQLNVAAFTGNELGGSGNYPSFSTNVVIKHSGNSYFNGGNVGIGTTSPGAKLEVNAQSGGVGGYTGFKMKYGTTSVQSLYMGQVTAGNGAFIGTAQYRNAGYWQTEGTASSVINMDAGGNIGFYTNSGLTANTDFNISERMRITSGGEVLIRRAVYTDTTFSLQVGDTGNDSYRPIRCEVASTAARTQIAFYNPSGNIGTISTTSSSTAYNTSSDYRLKENVVEMTGALDRVNQLKPSRFNFIADEDKTVDGFLAHEVQDIVPEAITGEKDAVDEEGNPVYQGIDQSKLVPLLVGAIKELKAEVETLKNQINGIN